MRKFARVPFEEFAVHVVAIGLVAGPEVLFN
jgi:hypothetical protein